MGLVKKITSILCVAAFAGTIYAATPVKTMAQNACRVVYNIYANGAVANVNGPNSDVAVKSSNGRANINGANSRISINGNNNDVYVNGSNSSITLSPGNTFYCSGNQVSSEAQRPSQLESMLEGQKIMRCDEINCYYHIVKKGSLELARVVPPKLHSLKLEVNGDSGALQEIKAGDTLILKKNDIIKIAWPVIEWQDLWRSYHNTPFAISEGGYSDKFIVNFRGFDSGSKIREDGGHNIRYSDLMARNQNPDGTWSIEVREKRDFDIMLGEVFIKYKEEPVQPKTAVINIEPYIDDEGTDGTIKVSFCNNVLAKASDNLYSNFNIKLEWGDYYSFDTSRNDTTSSAFGKFKNHISADRSTCSDGRCRRVSNKKQVYALFFRGEDSDGTGGIASPRSRNMVVDSNHSVDCVASTVLHELGHIFGLGYDNPGDEHHLSEGGYIMSNSGGCSLTWHPESKKQIQHKLNSGGLDHLIIYK